MIRLNILEFESRIEEKKMTVDAFFERDVMLVTADQDNIAQVIYNLLDNACKYGAEGGMIRVSVVHEGAKTRISIANSGKEIPPDMLPFIFDRFYKTDKSRGVDSAAWDWGSLSSSLSSICTVRISAPQAAMV